MQQKTPETVNTKDQYRIWFSNNPHQFLPPLHQVTLEESGKNNPQCMTILCVAKNYLTEQAREQLKAWSEQINCRVKDIEEIHVTDKIDQIILEIVKQEIKYWIMSPHIGNPAIASDYLRLLLVDQGVYLDCDILVLSNTLAVKMPHGCFVGNYFNNDVLGFSSENGKKILSLIKKKFVRNYFKIKDEDSIDDLDVSDVAKEIERQVSIRQEKIKNSALEGYVIALAGPEALEEFFKGYSPASIDDSGSWTSKELMNFLEINASSSYQKHFYNKGYS